MKSLFPEVEVTRLLSSNLFKMGFTTLQEGEKRVIDTNDLVAKRIEALAEKMARPENIGFMETDSEDGFSAGLNAELVEGLLVDEDVPEGSSNVIKASEDKALQQARLAKAEEEAEQILNRAKEAAEAEREELLAQARVQIEEERKTALTQANEQGYAEGLKKAEAELASKLRELEAKDRDREAQYEHLLEGMEMQMVDALTGIYEHLFKVELGSYREILISLLADALRKIEGGKDFLVHISPEDYPYVSMEKKQLMASLTSPNASLELVEDITLKKNECLIETDNGIYDCGLGTHMEELGRRLKLLSYEKS